MSELQETVLKVTVGVRVPGVHDATTVQEILERLIGTGQGECIDMIGDPFFEGCQDDAKLAVSMRFGGWLVEVEDVDGPDCDCRVDVDNAFYVGNGADGVYYQVFEDSHGDYWWSAIVDSNTGAFCDVMTEGAGPYKTRDEALYAARDEALEWCACNTVADESPRLRPGCISASTPLTILPPVRAFTVVRF
ncbi:MAG: hypothetical protein ACYSW8_32015 [Planctomycetota bacterium]